MLTSAGVAFRCGHIAVPITRFVGLEMIKGGRTPIRHRSMVAVTRVITVIHVTYPADLAGSADGDIGTVQGMLDELVRRGGEPVRKVGAALRAMGYVPDVPERRGDKPREVYLGWVDPARDYITGKFTLSLDSKTVWLSHLDDQQQVRDMPGAYSTGGYVALRIYEPGGVARATDAARKVKLQPPA